MEKFDFSGWATKANVKCSDGRTIMKDAFKHNNGKTVPLVWNHDHNDAFNVLGHALLENRDEGVYAYCKFNEDTEQGRNAKSLVEHGDVVSLSIFANKLKQQGDNVVHGEIRELSLVLAGANPEATIESIIRHGEESEEEAIIYMNEEISLYHAEESEAKSKEKAEEKADLKAKEKEDAQMEEKKDKTISEVLDTFNEDQKTALCAIVSQIIGDAVDEKDDKEEEEPEMKHNVFDEETKKENTLSHDAMATIINDGKRYGSLKESFLAHADNYGIKTIDYLFPEAENLNSTPEFIKRDMGWVSTVMNGVHRTPFSRIKSMFADITEDEARARGYIKGKLKKEEVFSLLKRTTTPTTIYKKQKLDRDDVVDITDFDVVAWLKSEMRMMLDEEIARAILVGDGRLSSSDDKINEDCIRPIWKDADLYSIKRTMTVASAADKDIASDFIDEVVRGMADYKGSGSPICFMTEALLTECLLLKDKNGIRLYKDVNEIATAMRVGRIVTVPVMEGLTRAAETDTLTLKAIVVNLNDYNVGADKGGSINMFDDFDIDYNQQKYLIETRCSGALTKPKSAIVFETKTSA